MRAFTPQSVVLAAGLLALAACNRGPGGVSSSDDMSMGNPKAPVTFIEYGSVNCPFCAKWDGEVFPQFKAKYIDTGKVYYTLRETPVHGAYDVAGFMLARCAGPDKYFKVVEALFGETRSGQNEPQGGATPYRAVLERTAKSVGMSDADYNKCVSDEKAMTAMADRTKKETDEYNINSTPSFIVDGHQEFADNPPTAAQLDSVIQAELAKKKS